ncbi:cyclic nucleotide-binding domain-containing protein [Pseudomarimonas salicorniae]|uniref:Cyclic nucleotide-binding domain-containing protein n=1 Tax=Pseudomarimonas salicorniae TaxID=2933270 RepID=A0ABT0GCR0_9GAMM|nr:cyclic nucleotide-binding domain-containing protein [Lysobacter sp. CAU 1642]MCK7592326.1 cyclic nucleotide-binding domain-containing protein [Lysobacter sp. CAU 1642]
MTIEASDLAKLYPLDSLRPETREQLAGEAAVNEYLKGEELFRAGDVDGDTFYVLEGIVESVYPDGRSKQFNASSLQGRYAIGDSQPRRFTARVVSPSARVLRLDRRYTEKVIAWDQLSRSENFRHFDPSPEGNRWVFRLLQSRAFHKLPTGNIERMFSSFEEISVRAGEVVIKEGDSGDYFYVIKEGAASVSKFLDGAETVVAYLVRGDCFGEDALLSNSPRNATVKMMQDGRLMRLARKAFEDVLKPPVVEWLSPGQASILARKGAVVVDVRLPAEHAQRSIKGSLNIPLSILREEASEKFDRRQQFVVYCNTGERSAAAAFILTRLGYTDVYALQGGLAGMLKQQEKTAAG